MKLKWILCESQDFRNSTQLGLPVPDVLCLTLRVPSLTVLVSLAPLSLSWFSRHTNIYPREPHIPRFGGSGDAQPPFSQVRRTFVLPLPSSPLASLSPLAPSLVLLPWPGPLDSHASPFRPCCHVLLSPTRLTPALPGPQPHSTMVGVGVHSWNHGFKAKVNMSYIVSYREASRWNITVRGYGRPT
jgi:hypothetical protein